MKTRAASEGKNKCFVERDQCCEIPAAVVTPTCLPGPERCCAAEDQFRVVIRVRFLKRKRNFKCFLQTGNGGGGVTGGRHYTKVASCFCPLPCAHPWSFSITSVLSPDVLTEQIRTPPCLEVVFWPGAILEKHCHSVWSHPWKRRGGAGRGKKVHACPQKSVGVCGTSGCLFVLHRQQAGAHWFRDRALCPVPALASWTSALVA